MLPPDAIQRFTEQQRQLVHDTYDEAWRQGVAGYEPDADPEQPTPAHLHQAQDSALAGLLLLKARSERVYTPPPAPDMARRQAALAAALHSTDRMAGELAQLSPTPDQQAEAQQEADEGKIDATAVTSVALAAAAADWAESNARRLDAGESVAWAGEQAGYAEAATTDGMLLQWQDEGDESVCGDCVGLAELGPLPLEEFPTTPGSGDTECNVGCRCALEATGVPLQDELAPLNDSEEATVSKVTEQARERLDSLAPQFASTG